MNNLDHKIQKLLNQTEVQPSAELWDRLQAERQLNKRSNRWVYWSLLALLLSGSTAAVYLWPKGEMHTDAKQTVLNEQKETITNTIVDVKKPVIVNHKENTNSNINKPNIIKQKNLPLTPLREELSVEQKTTTALISDAEVVESPQVLLSLINPKVHAEQMVPLSVERKTKQRSTKKVILENGRSIVKINTENETVKKLVKKVRKSKARLMLEKAKKKVKKVFK